MSATRDAFLAALAFILPPSCLGCHRVDGVESLPLGLCRSCASCLQPAPKNEPNLLKSGSYGPDWVACRWLYQPPLDAVIHALKYGQMDFLGRDLADALHQEYGEILSEEDVIVPIPLHWYRRLRRGYNQAEAIGRPLAQRLGVPLARALKRQRPTRPQTGLGRFGRHANLQRAFIVRPGVDRMLAGRRVLLVDDVMTTGATIGAAARALAECGAVSVSAVTVGRTPGRGPDRRSGAGNSGFLTRIR